MSASGTSSATSSAASTSVSASASPSPHPKAAAKPDPVDVSQFAQAQLSSGGGAPSPFVGNPAPVYSAPSPTLPLVLVMKGKPQPPSALPDWSILGDADGACSGPPLLFDEVTFTELPDSTGSSPREDVTDGKKQEDKGLPPRHAKYLARPLAPATPKPSPSGGPAKAVAQVTSLSLAALQNGAKTI
jgi:hypothetical protein